MIISREVARGVFSPQELSSRGFLRHRFQLREEFVDILLSRGLHLMLEKTQCQFLDRRHFENCPQWEFCREFSADIRYDSRSQQRMPAQIEETVMNADALDTKD